MKVFYTFLIAFLFQFHASAQIEDHWPGVCTNLDFEYTLDETNDPLVYKLYVDINNIGNDTIFTYCDVYETPTQGVTLSGNMSCYPVLAPGETKPIEITVTKDSEDIDCFTVDFKVKNGALNAVDYCLETTEFCTITPMSIEEIDRSNMEYTSTFYDMLGRKSKTPLKKGFYIERKLYSDGYQAVEKIYINQ